MGLAAIFWARLESFLSIPASARVGGRSTGSALAPADWYGRPVQAPPYLSARSGQIHRMTLALHGYIIGE